MEKLLLIALITAVALVVWLTGRVMPQYSSVLLLLAFMMAYVWLLTLAMVHQKRMDIKRPRPLNADYLPAVSVIIAAHNEAVVIEETVRRLMTLDYPDYEVFVLDDRSTDATTDILMRLAREFEDSLPGRFRTLKRAPDSTPGKPAVLNEALALTQSEVLCVFDADAAVESDFLRRVMPFLSDDNVGAVQARKIVANCDENWLTRCQDYEYSLDSHFQYGRDSVRGAVELRGNGQLVKREALMEVDGWNERTLTDDLDLSTRLHLAGWDIRFAHKVAVYEEGITRFGALLKQRRRWTEGTLFRYLEHAGRLLHSPKVSLRVLLDMVAYLLEFLLPLWLAFDFIQLAIDALSLGVEPIRLLSSLVVVPVFCFSMSVALVVAIIRFNRPPVGQAVLWGVITGLYMTTLWFPLVFGIIVKVLFQRQRRLRWDKTEHSGAAHRHAAALKP